MISAELLAAISPIPLPADVERTEVHADLSALVHAHMTALAIALTALGRDSSAMVLVAGGDYAIVLGSRGTIREDLRGLGPIARTCAVRLEQRAPRGAHWVVVVTDDDRAITMLALAPGNDLVSGGDA
jgi:hypothetical protein